VRLGSPHGNDYEDVTAENKSLRSSLDAHPHVGTAASTLANGKLSFDSDTTYSRTLLVSVCILSETMMSQYPPGAVIGVDCGNNS